MESEPRTQIVGEVRMAGPGFPKGNTASVGHGRGAATERRRKAFEALERELTAIGGPLSELEKFELGLCVDLADRSRRAPVGDRTAERSGSTAARLLRGLRAAREKLKPPPKSANESLREYLASKEHAGSAQ
jgi:hypothetical protein